MSNENILKMQQNIKAIIDDLKGLCAQNGLSNQAEEERIITTVFLYKFLNDKFSYNLEKFAKAIGEPVEKILGNEDELLEAFYAHSSQEVAFTKEETIQHLLQFVNQDDFYKKFDDALVNISNNPNNARFSIRESDGSSNPLFEPVTTSVQAAARNNFARSIFSYIAVEKFSFSEAFELSFDFYETIFEYLIKDYNVASGTYAEYYTPQVISSLIAKILVHYMGGPKPAEIYDPAAGSGSLVLHLAHELGTDHGVPRAIVYTQDISNKSTRFLRLNLMLNGMTMSLNHVIQGDTLLNPAHYTKEHDPSTGLKKFTAAVSNPPFKMDFSSTRDQIESKWLDTERFESGVPNIPPKNKKSMEIYLMFMQHILYSLHDDGVAAIVVPTGFLTAQTGIAKAVRQKLIDQKMVKGVLSMPSQIFANTGTNVSIIFIDKAGHDGKVLMVDASKLGKKVKDGKNQRTVLSTDESAVICNDNCTKNHIKAADNIKHY